MQCTEREKFVRAISWMGVPPYPLLFYLICKQADRKVIEEIRPCWPVDAEYHFFELADDWPFEVALIEIHLNELDDQLDIRIKKSLELMAKSQNTAAFCMFEGGFADYRYIFSLALQNHHYGLCIDGSEAFVCTIDEKRESIGFSEVLSAARSWLLRKFPTLPEHL